MTHYRSWLVLATFDFILWFYFLILIVLGVIFQLERWFKVCAFSIL